MCFQVRTLGVNFAASLEVAVMNPPLLKLWVVPAVVSWPSQGSLCLGVTGDHAVVGVELGGLLDQFQAKRGLVGRGWGHGVDELWLVFRAPRLGVRRGGGKTERLGLVELPGYYKATMGADRSVEGFDPVAGCHGDAT